MTNVGNDRTQLSKMAEQAKTAMGADTLDVLADRGYFKGEEILAGEAIGVTPFVPKSLTSGAKAEGRFGKTACLVNSAGLADARERDQSRSSEPGPGMSCRSPER